jgi:hypothetical protein
MFISKGSEGLIRRLGVLSFRLRRLMLRISLFRRFSRGCGWERALFGASLSLIWTFLPLLTAIYLFTGRFRSSPYNPDTYMHPLPLQPH